MCNAGKSRVVKTERKKGTKTNANVKIKGVVVSFPAPHVTWLRLTTFVWTVQRDKYDYRYIISSNIQITSEEGFGEHGIRICNALGCVVENITLHSEGKFMYVYHLILI